MFLPARMRKLKIITFEKYTDPVIRSLHEEGITQIDNISERIQEDPQWAQLLKPSKPTPQTTRIASLLMRTTSIIDFMDTLITKKKKIKEVIKEFLNPPIPKKRPAKNTALLNVKNQAPTTMTCQYSSKTQDSQSHSKHS